MTCLLARGGRGAAHSPAPHTTHVITLLRGVRVLFPFFFFLSFLFFPLSLPSPFSLSLFDADQHIGDG